MTTATDSKQPADTAKGTETKPSAPAPSAAPAKSVSASVQPSTPAPPAPKVEPKYKSEDYNNVPIVKLRIKQAGTMQYDPQYHLKLDSTEGVEMPLTPFFAERIGRTIELCA